MLKGYHKPSLNEIVFVPIRPLKTGGNDTVRREKKKKREENEEDIYIVQTVASLPSCTLSFLI